MQEDPRKHEQEEDVEAHARAARTHEESVEQDDDVEAHARIARNEEEDGDQDDDVEAHRWSRPAASPDMRSGGTEMRS